MCFSAQASFTAGTVLLIVGAATVRRARVRSELPYAWIPVLFGIQQLLEGAGLSRCGPTSGRLDQLGAGLHGDQRTPAQLMS